MLGTSEQMSGHRSLHRSINRCAFKWLVIKVNILRHQVVPWGKINIDQHWDRSGSFTLKAQQQGVHGRGVTWRTFNHTIYVCSMKKSVRDQRKHDEASAAFILPNHLSGRRALTWQHAFGFPPLLPALCASPKRISVMLLGSLWDLPRCNTRSSSSPSDDAMVTTDAQFQRRNQPRSSARRAGVDLMWLECCGCSSWSTIRSRAGETHYAHSIMPPSGAARKILL